MIFKAYPLHEIHRRIDVNAHYHEVFGQFPEIDWTAYLNASMLGHVIVITAEDGDIIAGYAVYFVSGNLRNTKNIEAENQAFYIEKKYRGKLGKDLIRKSHDILKSLGVQETLYRNDSKVFGDWIQKQGAKEKYKIWSVKNE